MSEYRKEVLATNMNTVDYSIFRNDKKVFTQTIEPMSIGFIKILIIGLFLGTPRLQQALFDKAHNQADGLIKVMSKNEVELK